MFTFWCFLSQRVKPSCDASVLFLSCRPTRLDIYWFAEELQNYLHCVWLGNLLLLGVIESVPDHPPNFLVAIRFNDSGYFDAIGVLNAQIVKHLWNKASLFQRFYRDIFLGKSYWYDIVNLLAYNTSVDVKIYRAVYLNTAGAIWVLIAGTKWITNAIKIVFFVS